MTIQEAIDRANVIRFDDLSTEMKVRWLSALDARLFQQDVKRHEDPIRTSFEPYSPNETGQELLVPFPYDEIYVHYLLAKRDEVYGEMDQYNNDAAAFNDGLTKWRRQYHRTHMPI